ncbi:MAG: PP0621 family protein [Methylophilaceae bacterium]
MPRILLLIILFWLFYIVVKRLINHSTSNDTSTKKTEGSENMVACSQCGLHIPENESLMIDNLIVCNNPKCLHPKK